MVLWLLTQHAGNSIEGGGSGSVRMEFPFLWELWEFLPLVWLQASCNRNAHYHTLWSIFETFNCLERKYSFLNERLNHSCPNHPPPRSPHHHPPPPSKIHGAPLTWQEWSKIWDISHPIIMNNLFSLLKIYATAKVSTLCCMECNIAR